MSYGNKLFTAVLIFMLSACAAEAQQMTAEEALAKVEALVDTTLAEIAPDAKLTSDALTGGQVCENSLTGITDQRSYDYGFSFLVPDEATGERLVDQTAKLWKEQGHEVDDFSDDQYAPSLHISENGFNYQFVFARRTLSVSVGGSTPCVNPLPGDA